MAVSSRQRFTRQRPCPVCGGYDQAPRGKGVRCFGFLSEDGLYAHCTREDLAGGLQLNTTSDTYAHHLDGDCGCEQQHDPRPARYESTAKDAPKGKIVAVYDYGDFEVVRFNPKGFKQRRPDAKGGWIWDLGGVTPHLYRRYELLAAPLDATVWLPEGEKDVECLRSLGLVATTNPGGAGKWRREYSADLAGRNVVVLADADDPGRRHAQQVAASIQGMAASVKVTQLPGAKDVSDWLLGHTREELQAVVDTAPLWTPLPSGNGQRAGNGSGVQLRQMAAVKSETVEWLWHPYIPLGKITLLEGDPGVGKSWVTLAIATAVSLGSGLPGTSAVEPRNVVLASAEDGLGDTIRPHLDAMGADVSRIQALDGPFTLDDVGFLILESAIARVRPRLLVLDPLAAYVGSGVDIYRANETRPVMARLARLAESNHLAVLVIRHLAKAEATKAIYRGVGSIDFTAASRSVLLAGCDPENPAIRGIVQVKSNLAPSGPSLGYELRDGAFYWMGESALTAADILAADHGAGASALGEAKAFLKEALAAGPVPAAQVWEDAHDAGLADRTVSRAKGKIGVVTHRQGSAGKRGGGGFMWHLPGDLECQECQVGKVGIVNHFEAEHSAVGATLGIQNGVEV